MRMQAITLAVSAICLASCDTASSDGGDTSGSGDADLIISVEKLETYRSDCDVTFRVTNKSNAIVNSDSISMLAVDEKGSTLSRMLVNVINVRPGRSVSEKTYAMNVGCNEISKFTSLAASYSSVGPDPTSSYAFE